jgi:hypothetical protein
MATKKASTPSKTLKESQDRALEAVNNVLEQISVDVDLMKSGRRPTTQGNCFGTAGTFGSVGGCFGTFGTYGCRRAE